MRKADELRRRQAGSKGFVPLLEALGRGIAWAAERTELETL